ncbi:ectoine hydrolase DoeA (plasmid) [Sinorhizobium meliloti]|uniref:M24 family metallopeptidase n=1 Tax=Rhizobium meliloti TaxID=382 RepID=UPI000B49B28B|nr:M24 family metallopeptidase [Sinorhizobium meliloti]ASP89520.1 ectoine hydrolase DoeA [Sinorhizobium meliloti]MQW24306.1 M24 family metallopeptidase [Sinorhizobium meliloti]
MTAPTLRFEIPEYKARLEATRKAMEQEGVDLLIVTDPANMAWLTGYDGWSFYVHQCVLVYQDEDPIWFGREMDANGARRTVYMDEGQIKSYADHYVQSSQYHPMTALAALIVDQGRSNGTIGIEKDNYYFTHAAFEALSSGLPNATFKDTTRLVKWQRIVKSRREIEYMEAAGKIVTGMHQRIAEVLRPGVKQSDVVAEIYHTGTRGVDGYWGDYPAAVPMIGAGADASAPHLTWTDRELRSGESIFFELAGVHKRYHCPLSRTFYLGKPDQKFIDAEKAVSEGMEAGLDKAVPGNTCEDVAKAYYGVIERYGLKKPSRAGYSIGLAYPPDWGEHSASFRLGDHTELRAGMTFHFMSGLWFGDWGIEITESIQITDRQAKCLASSPRQLIVID